MTIVFSIESELLFFWQVMAFMNSTEEKVPTPDVAFVFNVEERALTPDVVFVVSVSLCLLSIFKFRSIPF